MYAIQSQLNGKRVFLNAGLHFDAEAVTTYPTRVAAEFVMYRHPLMNRCCEGADAELSQNMRVVEVDNRGRPRN